MQRINSVGTCGNFPYKLNGPIHKVWAWSIKVAANHMWFSESTECG